MTQFYTIGHSNLTIARFIQNLQAHAVEAVVDVRSTPRSGRYPHFSRAPLTKSLLDNDIAYAFLGDKLGGRPKSRDLYSEDGRADYDAMAGTDEFRSGMVHLRRAPFSRVAITCSEGAPLDCHRALLVARALDVPEVAGHILRDGSCQSQEDLEQELLRLSGLSQAEELYRQASDVLAEAYSARAHEVAFSLTTDEYGWTA